MTKCNDEIHMLVIHYDTFLCKYTSHFVKFYFQKQEFQMQNSNLVI
jgi:hypothetical protein